MKIAPRAVLSLEPRAILLRRNEKGAQSLGFGQERGGVGFAKWMVVGEAARLCDGDASFLQRIVKLGWPADAAEGQIAALAQFIANDGNDPRVKDGQSAKALREAVLSAAAGIAAQQENCVRKAELEPRGARSGPSGNTRPEPTPAPASTTTRLKSLLSDGFWKPSSITMVSTPSVSSSFAPAGRSRLTTVGAARARSKGSSPTLSAPSVAASIKCGPRSLPP